jgi:heme exporter protein B
LSGAITASVNAGPALVPLLVTPLAIPLLLGATQTVEAIDTDGGNLSWLVLMMIVVLVLAIVGVATARPLQETR